MASDREIEAAAKELLDMTGWRLDECKSIARSVLEAAERVRAEQPQVPTMFPIRGTAD